MATVNFHTPRRNQGQMVEVSYGATDDGYVIRSRFDRRDGGRLYEISRRQLGDDGDYWNDEPPNDDWREMTAAEMDRYELS